MAVLPKGQQGFLCDVARPFSIMQITVRKMHEVQEFHPVEKLVRGMVSIPDSLDKFRCCLDKLMIFSR